MMMVFIIDGLLDLPIKLQGAVDNAWIEKSRKLVELIIELLAGVGVIGSFGIFTFILK